MKTVLAISALTAFVAAESFGVISARSASPVHLLTMNAKGGKFFLGGSGGPTSYCPPQIEGCPSGNQTLFAGGVGTLSLDVVVPGGQQIYVSGEDASLSYTAPHSTFKPNGSIVDGFTKTEGASFGTLGWTKGFIACPTSGDKGYQVFGAVDNKTFAPECLGFDALTTNGTGPGAWEY